MQLAAKEQAPPLPPLRQELRLERDKLRDRWLLHDPVRGRFHAISHVAFTALSRWATIPPEDFIELLNQTDPNLNFSNEELEELTEFLLVEKLLDQKGTQDAERLATHEAAMRKPWHEQLIHKYLFFRIPLWNPQPFLDRTGPSISKFLRPAVFKTIFCIGLIGLYFSLRQWETFTSTFLYFFTPQGFAFYGISLFVLKILHELGHAYAARHFGARVPVIGLAFLVMFPILYTDTTDAWRVEERRSRTLINGAGITVELCIAALSLFLWAFLPDGIFRSIVFFAATTSWAMSLFVNLNPWMRFDGYYLISDLLGVENLQKRGFEVGRWVMRNTLFGLDEGLPESYPRKAILGMTLYAWSTWIYRFFLFLGIAILVHHIFPKAIGIVLFTVEIAMFIAVPMWREIKHWWSQRMSILSHNRGRATLALSTLALLAFVVPWPSTISAPALIRPANDTKLFPPISARIEAMTILNGQFVEEGDVLMQLSSPALDHAKVLAALDLNIAETRWDQRAASLQNRQSSDILRDELEQKREALDSVTRELERLTLRAPHNGVISDLADSLTPGTQVQMASALLRVSDPSNVELIALPSEKHAARLVSGNAFVFISDQAGRPKRDGKIDKLAPTTDIYVTEPILTVIGGGPIAVTEDEQGHAIADIPVFRVSGPLLGERVLREERGIARIEAEPRSAARTVWNSTMGILLRETDF
jgi:putative peptide zinc metalloprotease protein